MEGANRKGGFCGKENGGSAMWLVVKGGGTWIMWCMENGARDFEEGIELVRDFWGSDDEVSSCESLVDRPSGQMMDPSLFFFFSFSLFSSQMSSCDDGLRVIVVGFGTNAYRVCEVPPQDLGGIRREQGTLTGSV